MGRDRLNRLLLLGCLAAVILACPAAAAAEPVISMSPNPAKTGAKNRVTFGAPPGATDISWDLNGDGAFGDAEGSSPHWAYDLPGTVRVGLRYTDPTGTSEVVEPLLVEGPPAVFVVYPALPVQGEPVTFVYNQGPALPEPPEWDLNGDGVFPDATGQSVSRSFPAPGTYTVGVRVTDVDDAVSTGFRSVTVVAPAPPPPVRPAAARARLMSPFPVVRITGRVTKKGAHIKRLSVRAPYGATVSVRCRGRGCPFRRTNRTLALAGRAKTPSKTITIRKLANRLLRGGTIVKVLVTRKGEIGKYTRFKIRRGKAPQRIDDCLPPGSTAPTECPTS